MLYFLFTIIGGIAVALLLWPQLKTLQKQNEKTFSEIKQEILTSGEIAA